MSALSPISQLPSPQENHLSRVEDELLMSSLRIKGFSSGVAVWRLEKLCFSGACWDNAWVSELSLGGRHGFGRPLCLHPCALSGPYRPRGAHGFSPLLVHFSGKSACFGGKLSDRMSESFHRLGVGWTPIRRGED